MEFVNPHALWLLALVPVIVLLHLWKHPRRILRVSHLFLWQRNEEQPAATLRWLYRRPNLLLILQLLGVVTLTGALARPLVRGPGGIADEVILVFDASASMTAREEGSTRFEMAQRIAAQRADQLGKGARVRLLLAKSRPEFVSDWLTQRQETRRRIGALSASHSTADLGTAVLLALESLSADTRGRVLVLSDGAQNADLPTELLDSRVEYVRLGTAGENLGIRRLAVRASRISPFDQDVLVDIASFSKKVRTARLRLRAGDRALLEQELSLGPGERRAIGVEGVPIDSPLVEAHLEVDDDLEVDDHAWAPVRMPRSRPVLLATDGNIFLEQVLAIDPWVDLTVVRPSALAAARSQKAYDLVVLDGAGSRVPESGRLLVFRHPTASAVPVANGGASRTLQAGFAGEIHPVMDWVDFGSIRFRSLAPIEMLAGELPLVEIDGQVVLSAIDRGAHRRITVGFDVRQSTWPFSVSFPVFMSNAVRWLSRSEHSKALQIRPGEVLTWRVPEAWGAAALTLRRPDGRELAIDAVNGTVVFEQTDRVGPYTLRAGGQEAHFAVNLFSDAESDLAVAAMSAVRDPGASAKPVAESDLQGHEISRILILLAVALLTVEGWGFWRRVRG